MTGCRPARRVPIPDGLPFERVPDRLLLRSIASGTSYFWFRNTFFWSKRAHAQAPGDYAAAKLIHWTSHVAQIRRPG